MDPQTPQISPVPPLPPTPPVIPPEPTNVPATEAPQPTLSTPTPEPAPVQLVNPAFQPLSPDVPQTESPITNPLAGKKGMPKFVPWLIFVIIFGVICFAPLTPGIVITNLPGNSDGLVAVGSSQVDCNGTSVPTTEDTSYQNKKGLPLSYNYAQVVTTSDNCGGSQQFLGSTSVVITNLTAVAVDAVVVLVLALLGTAVASKLRNRV